MKVPSPLARGRRAAGLFALMTLVAVAVVGSANATHSTTDTTAVQFVSITPKQVLGNAFVGANVKKDVVVIGAATTVPTNATTVRLDVSVKGAAGGTLKFYPTANAAGGAGHTLAYPAGSTIVSGTTAENIGLGNKVTIENASTGSANVTVKITGYSTQVTAGDINGSGGTKGQVLTNNGAGGAAWKTPAQAWGNFSATSTPLPQGVTTVVDTQDVPAGSYLVSWTADLFNPSGLEVLAHCALHAPNGAQQALTYTSAQPSTDNTIALQALMSTATPGQIQVRCQTFQNGAQIYVTQLMALQVGATNGTPANNARQSTGITGKLGQR